MARGAGVLFPTLFFGQRFIFAVVVLGFSGLGWVLAVNTLWHDDFYRPQDFLITQVFFLLIYFGSLMGVTVWVIRRLLCLAIRCWRKNKKAPSAGGLTLYARICMTIFSGSWLLPLFAYTIKSPSPGKMIISAAPFWILLGAILFLAWRGWRGGEKDGDDSAPVTAREAK